MSQTNSIELTPAQIATLQNNSPELASDKELTGAILERDYWSEKATELADLVGQYFVEEMGEHSNMNCPVENAIDWMNEMLQTKTDDVGT